MNILLASSLYPPNVLGGAERSVQLLAETLTERGHRVAVVTTQPQGDEAEAELNGVRVHYVPVRNVYRPFSDNVRNALKPAWHAVDTSNPLMAAAVGRVLRQERPDLLHTNTLAGFSPRVWAAAKRLGVPVVHTIRDHYLLCIRSSMFRDGENCSRRCAECWALSLPRVAATRQVDAVSAVSRYMLEHHLAFGAFRRTPVRRVIHNAYQPGPSEKAASPAPADGVDGPLRVGFLGRLHPTKGVEMLLKAAALLPGDAVHVVLAGRGESDYERYLRERFAGSNVTFLGFTDPADLFARIDVLAVPALWHEPFPRVTFEAFAHGVPVVASRRGGIPEAIDEGCTGLLFDPDAPSELAGHLRSLASDRVALARMGRAAREAAAAYRPETVAAQYESLYAEVVGGG